MSEEFCLSMRKHIQCCVDCYQASRKKIEALEKQAEKAREEFAKELKAQSDLYDKQLADVRSKLSLCEDKLFLCEEKLRRKDGRAD